MWKAGRGGGGRVSHRSDETEDTFIADLVVGLCTGQVGSVCRGLTRSGNLEKVWKKKSRVSRSGIVLNSMFWSGKTLPNS